MVIGIDAREASGRPAGKGRYVLELLRHLPGAMPKDRFLAYARHPADVPERSNLAWRIIESGGPRWHLAAVREANRHCDVYLSTTSYVTPLGLRIPYFVMVHDLIAFKGFAIPQRRARTIERRTLGRAARRATGVFTNSQATADDLAKLFPKLADRITVTPLAADPRFRADRQASELSAIRRHYGLPRRFVLTSGTIEPRKNLERLIRAYGRLPADLRSDIPLVLAGQLGWDYQGVVAAWRSVGEDTVRHLDYVPDDDLARLYAACTVFAYPSLYEGFGLPVLEAMQSGAPVITSRRSALPEVGGRAVRYIDPENTGELTDALSGLLRNAALRRRLKAAGLTQAEQFSWKETAKLTAKALRAGAKQQ